MIAASRIAVDLAADDDIDTLARTLWGEARGEGEPGMEAIAAVVLNRLQRSTRQGGRHWWGATIAAICRARLQFPCWNPANPDRRTLLVLDSQDGDFRRARAIAARAASGLLPDPTFGATHYRSAGSPWPSSWGHPRQPLATIGARAFFNLRDD
jgi:spore germination cell wall hydrolase CwlJ-like protein